MHISVCIALRGCTSTYMCVSVSACIHMKQQSFIIMSDRNKHHGNCSIMQMTTDGEVLPLAIFRDDADNK